LKTEKRPLKICGKSYLKNQGAKRMIPRISKEIKTVPITSSIDIWRFLAPLNRYKMKGIPNTKINFGSIV